MQIVQAPRASAILYNLLSRRADARAWILPANICPIVPITFFKARVPFEFADISEETLHIDLNQVEELMRTRKFGGLLYAHTYGEPSTPQDFFASLHLLDPTLMIIDDRCLCVPDLVPDRSSNADVILYSSGYAKIVEMNFGGYAFLNDEIDYRPVSLPFSPLHHEEIEKSYKESLSQRSDYVYRDSDWLETEMPLPTWNDYRQRVAQGLEKSLTQRAALNQIYSARLPEEKQLPHAYQLWRFNIRVKDKPRALDAIFKAGLFASSHYASLAGIMSGGRAPRAEALADEIINLFNDYHFDAAKASQACDIILE